MDTKYWINKWRSNDITFHEENVNADLIAYIDCLKLKPGDSIFIPLCGKTRDMIWLAEKGFNVIGVELSSIACNDFFSEQSVIPIVTRLDKFTKYQYKNIELFCGDLFDLNPVDLPIVNAVYDCKAFIALPSDVRKKYVDHMVSLLGAKIKILLLARDSNCKINPPPYPVSKEEVNLLCSRYFDIKLLKHLSITDIPEHLIKKGYTAMTESVYLISEKIE